EKREGDRLTVYFIGAGPGDPELLTIRGRDLIARCPTVLYAGSLVPPAVIAHAGVGARGIDTAPPTLDEIIVHIRAASGARHDVARGRPPASSPYRAFRAPLA